MARRSASNSDLQCDVCSLKQFWMMTELLASADKVSSIVAAEAFLPWMLLGLPTDINIFLSEGFLRFFHFFSIMVENWAEEPDGFRKLLSSLVSSLYFMLIASNMEIRRPNLDKMKRMRARRKFSTSISSFLYGCSCSFGCMLYPKSSFSYSNCSITTLLVYIWLSRLGRVSVLMNSSSNLSKRARKIWKKVALLKPLGKKLLTWHLAIIACMFTILALDGLILVGDKKSTSAVRVT